MPVVFKPAVRQHNCVMPWVTAVWDFDRGPVASVLEMTPPNFVGWHTSPDGLRSPDSRPGAANEVFPEGTVWQCPECGTHWTAFVRVPATTDREMDYIQRHGIRTSIRCTDVWDWRRSTWRERRRAKKESR